MEETLEEKTYCPKHGVYGINHLCGGCMSDFQKGADKLAKEKRVSEVADAIKIVVKDIHCNVEISPTELLNYIEDRTLSIGDEKWKEVKRRFGGDSVFYNPERGVFLK